MANFLGRLFVFDTNHIYKINPHTMVIEDTFEGIGCISNDSIVVTEYGMFFADLNGAYMHNGQTPLKISETIQQGGGVDVNFGGTDNVKDVSWNTAIKYNPDNNCKVIFDGESTSVNYIFTISHKIQKEANGVNILRDTLINKSYIWAYNITLKRWDLWELCDNSNIGKPFISKNGSVNIPIDDSIYAHQEGSSKKRYTWISKKLTTALDSSLKVFRKIKLNGLEDDLTLNGTYADSSDRLLVSTAKGVLSTSDVTYVAKDTGDGDYKLSGSNKSAKWLQFKLEEIDKPLDSIGIIFRTKSIR